MKREIGELIHPNLWQVNFFHMRDDERYRSVLEKMKRSMFCGYAGNDCTERLLEKIESWFK